MSDAARPGRACDGWFTMSIVVVLAAYAALPFLRSSGEGWGRGWNLVAYWFYSAPPVGIAGLVMVWRQARAGSAVRVASWLLPLAALLYPLAAYLVIRSANTGG